MQARIEVERLYGLDWLRIGALALLILYHIGMFFVPWDWHVKTAEPLDWLELPMLAINPWRLPLLFVISGVASRMLLQKMAGAGGFARSRSQRLLLPLLAGMVIFVAPQPWVELRAQGLYAAGFWQFWTHDYFRFGRIGAVDLPTWNHLWFVAYLWVYTMLLALLARAPRQVRARLQQSFDGLFAGGRLLVVPILFLAAARMLLFPAFGETHALIDDVYGHAVYGFAFVFGVGLAGSAAVWNSVLGQWKGALAAAIAAYALVAVLTMTLAAEPGLVEIGVLRLARTVQAWAMIVALLGIARLHLNYDGRARRYLSEAIFPYYIAHQTIIVLAGYWIAPLQLGAVVELTVILPATLIGCAVTFEGGRRIAWLRPLIGLKPISAPLAKLRSEEKLVRINRFSRDH